MKRYEKFVLEAEKGITFEVSEGTSGELIIRALNIATANVYSENYAKNLWSRFKACMGYAERLGYISSMP